MGQKYDVVGVILAPAGAAAGGGFCSTIFGLAVLAGVGFVCYLLVALYVIFMTIAERLVVFLVDLPPIVFLLFWLGGMLSIGLLMLVMFLLLILATKKK